MKAFLVVLCVLTVTLSCSAQTAAQLQQCKGAMDKDIEGRLVPEICFMIARYLAPGENISRVSDDGGFTTVSHGKVEEHWLPGRLQSTIFLATMRRYYGELEELARKTPQAGSYATPEETDFILNLWPVARDGFCKYHPGEAYTELSNIEAICPATVNRISDRADLNSKSTPPPLSADQQGPEGMCQTPITLAQAQKSGGIPYDCRFFRYPDF